MDHCALESVLASYEVLAFDPRHVTLVKHDPWCFRWKISIQIRRSRGFGDAKNLATIVSKSKTFLME